MTTEPSPRVCRISRRAMLAGTGAAGAVALTATGCGTTPKPQDALRGTVVAQTTDVPEGGGLLLMDAA